MKKINKNFKIDQLKTIVNNSDFLIILHHNPATTKETTQIRNSLKKTEFNMVITKKNLLIKALDYTYSQNLTDSVTGAVAVIYNTAPSPKLPAMLTSLKKDKYTVISGRYKNRLLDVEQWNWLKLNYSEEGVYSKVISTINAPAIKLARTLKHPAVKLGRAIKHISKESKID